MSVYERRGAFWGNWTDPDTGKRHRWPLGETVTTRRQAERVFVFDVEQLRATSRGKQLGLLSLAPENTVEAALDYIIAHPGEVSASTVEAYRKWKPRIIAHVGARTLVTEVSRERVAELVRALRDEGLADHSVEKPLNVLRRALRECLDRRDRHGLVLLDRLPTYKGLLRRGRYVPRDRYLTRDEYRILLLAMPASSRLWLVVAVYTGLHHPSDLGRFAWRDVDLTGGTWVRRNQKNGTPEARLDLPAPLARALRVEWASGAPFYRRYRGERAPDRADPIVGTWSYKDVVRRAAERGGIPPVCALDLRRTCATWLAERGVMYDEARRWFGHSTRSTMLETVYAQVSPERMSKAARALDFADGVDDVEQVGAAVGGTVLRLPAASSVEERPLYTGRVGGSNPSPRTIGDAGTIAFLDAQSGDAWVTEPDHLRGRGRSEVVEKTGERVRVKNPLGRSEARETKPVTRAAVTAGDAGVTQLDLQNRPRPVTERARASTAKAARELQQTGSRYCRRCAGWYSGSTLAHRKDCAR